MRELMRHIHLRHWENVEAILDGGLERIDETFSYRRENVLTLMIARDSPPRLFETIISRVGDPDAKNGDAANGLVVSAMKILPEHFRICLDLSKEVNCQNSQGISALMFCASNDCFGMLDGLTGRGCDLSLKDNQGNTALDIAISSRNETAFRKLWKAGCGLSHLKRQNRKIASLWRENV